VKSWQVTINLFVERSTDCTLLDALGGFRLVNNK
jgi:hypothetical protein